MCKTSVPHHAVRLSEHSLTAIHPPTQALPARPGGWWWERLVLLLAVALTRLAFRSHYLYDIDSVNFALGLRRFDVSVHQAHPPGYFLYICLARLIHSVVADVNLCFVLISVAASGGAAFLIYTLAKEWFGLHAGRCAGLLFVVSPLAWFYGTVALTYIVELFFSSLIGYLSWKVYCGAPRMAVPAAIALAVSAGFRPSSAALLGLLLVFAVSKLKLRDLLLAAAAFGITCLFWFVPMTQESGGWAVYVHSLTALWKVAGGKSTIFNDSIFVSIARVCTIGFIAFLCFGAPLLLLLAVRPQPGHQEKRLKLFTWIWLSPGLLFFSLIFLRFVNSGYLLLLTPPLFAWLGARCADWFAFPQRRHPWKIAAACVALAVNAAIFVWAPLYCSYSSVRQFEWELASVLQAVPQAAAAGDTLLVGFDSHFLGYRHAGYYLPQYDTAQYPEVGLSEGPRVFFMQAGDTHLAAELPQRRYTRFLLFPLSSSDSEARTYLRGIEAKLPPGRLTESTVGGVSFLSGAVDDLPILFPHAAPAAANVYSASQ